MKSRNAKTVDELSVDAEIAKRTVDEISAEHDRHCLDNSTDTSWFDSMPIETLRESLDFDLGRNPSKYSLKDMLKKFALKKLHEEKLEELISKERELYIAQLDSLIDSIRKI